MQLQNLWKSANILFVNSNEIYLAMLDCMRCENVYWMSYWILIFVCEHSEYWNENVKHLCTKSVCGKCCDYVTRFYCSYYFRMDLIWLMKELIKSKANILFAKAARFITIFNGRPNQNWLDWTHNSIVIFDWMKWPNLCLENMKA